MKNQITISPVELKHIISDALAENRNQLCFRNPTEADEVTLKKCIEKAFEIRPDKTELLFDFPETI